MLRSGLLKRTVGEGHVTCVHTVEFSTTRFVVRSSASSPFQNKLWGTRDEYTICNCVYASYRRLDRSHFYLIHFTRGPGSLAADLGAFVKVSEEKCQWKYSRTRCLRRAVSVPRTGPPVSRLANTEPYIEFKVVFKVAFNPLCFVSCDGRARKINQIHVWHFLTVYRSKCGLFVTVK